ncbi:hypothetical protein ACM79U_11720 [Pseudomonas aeruginosa]
MNEPLFNELLESVKQADQIMTDINRATRNLDAYYYGFDPTGCDLVDSVLEQVARAGKAFHSTDDWNEEDLDGLSPVDKMQAAANASAKTIMALIAEVERLKAELSQCASALPGTYYMDPPDGGNVSIPEQIRRMAKDAARYRALRQKERGVVVVRNRTSHLFGEHLDAAIDAAIEGAKQ